MAGDIVDVNLLSPAVQSPTLSPDTARIGMNVCVSRLEVDMPSKSTEVGDDKQTQMTLFNVPAELVGWVTDEENTMGDVSNMPTLDEDQPVHMCHVRVSVGDAEALRHMWVPMGNIKLIQPEVCTVLISCHCASVRSRSCGQRYSLWLGRSMIM